MKLFVYGTLKEPGQMARVCGDPRFILQQPEPGHLLNHALYRSGFFGIKPLEGSNVAGIVWHDLNDDHFARLDRYEGCPNLYVRAQGWVKLRGGGITKAYCYVANGLLFGNEAPLEESEYIGRYF